MKRWLRDKIGQALVFLLIAGLVAGGLGWMTAAVLRLEREQTHERAQAEVAGRLRLALWRLDSRISPLLAREDSRPYDHFSALYAPPVSLNNFGQCLTPGVVLQPSPLLDAELPSWMLLHFQVHAETGWQSPQAPTENVLASLQNDWAPAEPTNVTRLRRRLLASLNEALPPARLLAVARKRTTAPMFRDRTVVPSPPEEAPQQQAANAQPAQQLSLSVLEQQQMLQQEYAARSISQSRIQEKKVPRRYNRELVLGNTTSNGIGWLTSNPRKVSGGAEVLVQLSSLVPVWLADRQGVEHLLALRLVRIEDAEVCQGIVLDGGALCGILRNEIADLFPAARLLPMKDAVPPRPERTMTALPLELDPGVEVVADAGAGWTPLRGGLALAWLAAFVALLAVGLGGWSLIGLSERRIRFVSAVTHELRTPLTTLRLYLDMLLDGMVRDERQKQEYLETLRAEADRLSQLVGNVLSYSRLEKQRPQLARRQVTVGSLLGELEAAWKPRCRATAKELVLSSSLDAGAALSTDPDLLQQVLGNLLDNACKYSQGAPDQRVWVRARGEKDYLVLEVEDHGPGVPARERRSIFRAFRRGRASEAATGGVGLGLALAEHWARLLGGRLTLAPDTGAGACFRLVLPGLRTPTESGGAGEPGVGAPGLPR